MATEKSKTKELFESLDGIALEILQIISSLNEIEVNTIAFEDSWTPAQLISHVTKSNKGIAQALEMEGKPVDRDPAKRAQELKRMFLDFTKKYKSPEFILPTEDFYKKEKVIADLKKSIEQITELRSKVNLSEVINVPLFGEITRLELLYFVLYHTQRHIRQLKNITVILTRKQE
ncbi:MAG: DinB family protein [Bacteroidota bacterium]|nr:DinB family protein [Bacteroidota bacterium]